MIRGAEARFDFARIGPARYANARPMGAALGRVFARLLPGRPGSATRDAQGADDPRASGGARLGAPHRHPLAILA
jgi:hypothetical protein